MIRKFKFSPTHFSYVEGFAVGFLTATWLLILLSNLFVTPWLINFFKNFKVDLPSSVSFLIFASRYNMWLVSLLIVFGSFLTFRLLFAKFKSTTQ